ncbi:MAG: DUF1080 domain-containing protein [Bacteroidales bacterium]|nr:DUF1080 domain-containing protein [Bacteroidales bacterium]MCB9012458.1 DUF1080 domain-containing protein [Bacteroidales bacterium]
MKNYILIFLSILMIPACTSQQKPEEVWQSLFNGKNLDGWDVKFSGHPLNENFKNIFRVEDGLLKVSYVDVDSFRGEFGHIFYKTPYSNYRLKVEYRFTEGQAKGGPVWGYRNNGVMLHSQSAASMGLNQDFPVSIEAQLLGGDGEINPPTGNVCTPGTNIFIDGQLITQHCTESTSPSYKGDVWVHAEFVVFGDSIIHHIIEGDTVMTYTKPQIGGDGIPDGFPLEPGTPLTEGFISLQAESSPTEFRLIELLDLSKPGK